MIRKFFAALLAAALSVASAPAIAQSSATPVLPGLLVTSGCPSGVTACWVPYSNTNPLPVTGGGGGGGTTVTATAAAPSYVEGSTTNPLSSNLTGDLRVISKQSGTWNIANITGTISLPTNAAMETGGNLATLTTQQTNATTALGAPGDAVCGTATGTCSLTALFKYNNSSPLVAGTAVIGKVGIDQTTPGTTNGVVATGNVASGAADNGNPAKVGGVFNSSPATVTTGQRVDLQLSAKGRLIPEVTQTSGVDGQANANLGGFPAGGLSAVPMLTISSVFNSSTWDRWRSIQGADGTGLGIAAVAISPNSNANAALVPVVSTTLEGCHVLKASAGNLYSLSATIQATTVVIQVFNATSAPADGAVTPIWSMPVISNGTLGGDSWNFAVPLRGSTGLTVCASSATTPFTKTASATAMFSGQVQ